MERISSYTKRSGGGGTLWSLIAWTFVLLLFSETSGNPSPSEPGLVIFPSTPVQRKPIGQNVLLTCLANVENSDLVQELKWIDPNGRVIEGNSEGQYISDPSKKTKYIEMMPGGGLGLIIPSLAENEAGNYTCVATYANTVQLKKSVRVETIVSITYVDAPTEQYPILGTEYKVKCKVTANPAPSVDWYKNSEVITTNDHYVVETDGLLIRNVTEGDDGYYSCRAIVIELGQLSERHIKVEVHVPPAFHEMETTKEAVEGQSASLTCIASGKPLPKYSWIKSSTNEDLSKTPSGRFSVHEENGILTINEVSRQDAGEFKCVAHNNAGRAENSVILTVIVPPRILSFKNESVGVLKSGMLSCLAAGVPPPSIYFRKTGSSRRYVTGGQPDDDHVFVEPLVITDAEKFEHKEITSGANFNIPSVLRSDDGLYVCVAENQGGTTEQVGHLTVEFPPSFAISPVKEVWSWHNHAVNLTCLAESIPNATITWWLNERNIENDANAIKIGNGPQSTLTVIPLDRKYYGVYKCKASNIHGNAEHEIHLREAHTPSEILQAKLEVITATTITFSFMGPKNDGGLPTRAYAVQYKEERKSWNEAMNKTWFVDSPYILEGLEPQTTYNFRFAAKNDVGFGQWSADEQHTMPKRSNPEEPTILSTFSTHGGPEGGVVLSPYVDRYELRWKIPADNGEPIDKYDIKFCPARNSSDGWKESEKCDTVELKSHDHTAHELKNLQANTHYKIELRAHNGIGYSTPGQIIVKTAKDPTNTVLDTYMKEETPTLSSGVIIGIVIGSLLIILLIIDLSCCLMNKAGLFALVCLKHHKESKEQDIKNECGEKEPLKNTNGNKVGINGEEKQKIESTPMVSGSIKRETAIDFDIKSDTSRTTFAKHSAV